MVATIKNGGNHTMVPKYTHRRLPCLMTNDALMCSAVWLALIGSHNSHVLLNSDIL